jgi:hypothetical protein
MRKPVGNKQHLEMILMQFKIDGSAVTTSDNVSTGLLIGQHLATIKKGAGADSNLVTITLNSALGMTPGVFIQEVSLDLACRLETAATKTVIQVRTLDTDLTTKFDDADFELLVVGTEGIREGRF